MKQSTKFVVAVLAAASLLSTAACSSDDSGTPSGSTTASSSAADDMTLDQLIQAAKDEANASGAPGFMVYAPSSRVGDALKAFTAAYGIAGESYNASGQDLYTKLTTEITAGTKNTADVVLMQDSYLFQSQLVLDGYVTNYVPADLKAKIPAEDQSPLIMYYYNKLFIYNNTNDAKDITNVWDLTDAAYKGKVFIKDLSKESVNQNWLAMLTSDTWSAKLADAYKVKYGKDIVLDKDSPNAGYQYIRALLPNVKFGSGDGDIAVELADGNGGNVGLFVYSKLRDASVDSTKLTVSAYDKPQPVGFSGFMYPMYLQMVTNTDRPYTARLFIHFLMTKEGFTSAFQTKAADIGTYSTNSDIGPLEGDQPLAFWKDCLVIEDPEYLPQAYADGILDFITQAIG
jgi:iron(III) transport system substrate-binding protein